MTVKVYINFFSYHGKYLNSMKCREISMGPSIGTILCRMLSPKGPLVPTGDKPVLGCVV
jgi:hypothetical protein